MKKPNAKIAKKLRQDQTDAERKLWMLLRSKQFDGVKFRRQATIGKHIVDFVAYNKKLVIEVDGGQHADSGADQERDQWLKSQGFKVLRFWNNEVIDNIEGVLEVVRENCL